VITKHIFPVMHVRSAAIVRSYELPVVVAAEAPEQAKKQASKQTSKQASSKLEEYRSTRSQPVKI
jgi:hypothetical protein